MKESVKRLREAYDEYKAARQKRYNELVGHFSGDRTSTEAMDIHKKAVERINLEEIAEYVDASATFCLTSAPAYIDQEGLFHFGADGRTRVLEE